LTPQFAPLERLLVQGVRDGVFTAAVALVGLKGELVWQGGVGKTSLDPESLPVTLATVFDLASFTKPLATALALMLLMDRGLLQPDSCLGDLLPEEWLPEDKRRLTIGSLLAHRAGLPAWRPFYQKLLQYPPADRPGLLTRLAAAEALTYPPDTQTLYSDLGFILLQAVVEAVSGLPLDHFCQNAIYRPLGLETLGFVRLPVRRPAVSGNCLYAATEEGLIPGRNIFGEVHDENAWAAGGVAGHAGLFGTGPEVFALLAALYRTWQGDPRSPFRTDSVRRFFTPVKDGDRPFGFDRPHPEPSRRSVGRFFPSNSVGHLGFTGVSFWLDLDQGQVVVLLTNRVHLGRANDKIRAFRPRFHEAASQALGCGRFQPIPLCS